MRNGLKTALVSGASLLAGIVIGGYLFSKTQRRPVLSLRKCEQRCLKVEELTGLLASIALNKFPRLVPSVVLETDMTVAIRHPDPQKRVHYVVIPKKDITNVGALSDQDKEYLIDLFAVIQELVKEEHLSDYEVITNGPGKQTVTYLHFHLIAE
jgi:histidine triad (HIT) family protein